MSVVQIVRVVVMDDLCVTAIFAVLMRMVLVGLVLIPH